MPSSQGRETDLAATSHHCVPNTPPTTFRFLMRPPLKIRVLFTRPQFRRHRRSAVGAMVLPKRGWTPRQNCPTILTPIHSDASWTSNDLFLRILVKGRSVIDRLSPSFPHQGRSRQCLHFFRKLPCLRPTPGDQHYGRSQRTPRISVDQPVVLSTYARGLEDPSAARSRPLMNAPNMFHAPTPTRALIPASRTEVIALQSETSISTVFVCLGGQIRASLMRLFMV